MYNNLSDGQEYPVSLLWTGQTILVEDLHYYTISELDQTTLAMTLNLSSEDFAVNGTHYLKDFQWRGAHAYGLVTQTKNTDPCWPSTSFTILMKDFQIVLHIL